MNCNKFDIFANILSLVHVGLERVVSLFQPALGADFVQMMPPKTLEGGTGGPQDSEQTGK